MNHRETGPPFAIGDLVAFITFGRNPRALSGIVTDPQAIDRGGRPRIRVSVASRPYLARPSAMRKLHPPPRRTTMAYQFKDLSVLAYANGFTLWHYATADAATDLVDGRHFDAAAEMLRAGDIIIATAGLDDEGGAPPVALMLLVAGVANDGGGESGKVTLRDMLKAAA